MSSASPCSYFPKKKKIPVKAIREMCIECMGGRENIGYKEIITNCSASECALYGFRFGTDPYRSKLSLTDKERKARSDRAKSNFFTVLIT